MQYQLIKIKTLYAEEDNLGGLSVIEEGRDFPFNIKRIYYVHGTKGQVIRGNHAHKKLKQLLFCPFGSVKVCLDSGTEKAEVTLDTPEKGLIIMPCLWRSIVYAEDNSVLCVAASECYDEDDYIRDYAEFLEYVSGR